MTGVVVFDPAAFVLRYPQFAAYNTANPGLLQDYFDDATGFLNNTATSRVCDLAQRQRLLWLLTAHIATLAGAGGVTGTPGGIGRVTSATEGSVSISSTVDGVSANSAWYQTTPYGAAYWAATSNYRQFRYVAPRRFC